MTPKEGLSIVWAQGQMFKAMREGKSDTECMTVLKEAYEDAMALLGVSVYFDEEEWFFIYILNVYYNMVYNVVVRDYKNFG